MDVIVNEDDDKDQVFKNSYSELRSGSDYALSPWTDGTSIDRILRLRKICLATTSMSEAPTIHNFWWKRIRNGSDTIDIETSYRREYYSFPPNQVSTDYGADHGWSNKGSDTHRYSCNTQGSSIENREVTGNQMCCWITRSIKSYRPHIWLQWSQDRYHRKIERYGCIIIINTGSRILIKKFLLTWSKKETEASRLLNWEINWDR